MSQPKEPLWIETTPYNECGWQPNNRRSRNYHKAQRPLTVNVVGRLDFAELVQSNPIQRNITACILGHRGGGVWWCKGKHWQARDFCRGNVGTDSEPKRRISTHDDQQSDRVDNGSYRRFLNLNQMLATIKDASPIRLRVKGRVLELSVPPRWSWESGCADAKDSCYNLVFKWVKYNEMSHILLDRLL
jgi:hypothetical protein